MTVRGHDLGAHALQGGPVVQQCLEQAVAVGAVHPQVENHLHLNCPVFSCLCGG